MKTKPIGLRFEQEEYEKINNYAEATGMSFSEVVRSGTMRYVDPDFGKHYASLADIASSNTEDITLAFNQFLDDFSHASEKSALIEKEPEWSEDPGRWRFDFAATAHKLDHDHGLPVPMWALGDKYVSEVPLYAFDTENPEFQEYLRSTTPREFASHNLFLGENILTRA